MQTNRNVVRWTVLLHLNLLTIGLFIPVTSQAQSNLNRPAPGAASDGDQPAEPKAAHGPTIPQLQEMISRALKSHPEVRAARAQLLGAQANLDRVRLEVAQRIVDHQKIWRTLEMNLKVQEAKLREAQLVNQRAPRSIPAPHMQGLEVTLEGIRVELAGVKSQLPFILGHTAGEAPTRRELDEEREFAEQMVAHARTGYESAVAMYEGGKIPQQFVALWSKRLMEAEELLLGESTESVERHRQRMQSLLDAAKAGFEAGVVSQLAYVAAQYHVAEANLLLQRRE